MRKRIDLRDRNVKAEIRIGKKFQIFAPFCLSREPQMQF